MNWNVTAEKVFGDLWASYWSLFLWLRAWSWWKWTTFLFRTRIVFRVLGWQRSLLSLAILSLWWQQIAWCETIRIGSRNQVSERKFPCQWIAKRLCVLGASLLVIGVGFVSSYKPQVQQTNVQDQIDIIQMDNELEREQKFDQILDTITPEDKKSE